MSALSVPAGWATATISDLTEFVTSGSRGWAKHYSENGPLFVRVGNLDHDTITLDLADAQHVQPPPGAEGERTRVRLGDILLSITAEVGMVGLATESLGAAYVNQHVALLRPRTGVHSPGLAYSLLDPGGFQALAQGAQYGATKMALSLDQVRGFEVPVPPLREQHRIVAAIEDYFSRLDKAVVLLERVQRNLKRYRASVLKAAVEGRLVPTEAALARAEGRSYESASVLLERILEERRRRWQAEGRRGTYREPVTPDTTSLPELPEGWCWVTVDQLGIVTGGLTKNAKRDALQTTLPYLRVANVYANELRLKDVAAIGVDKSEINRLLLCPGDLLVVEGNGSIDQVGRVALWDGSIHPCVHQNHIIKVRFAPATLSGWVLQWLLSPGGRQAVQNVASSTSGLHTLSISKVASLPVPLSPMAEQHRLREEIDRLLSAASDVEVEAVKNVTRCARLRQSILKWAFEGRLVGQDPTDEPASVLLDRIRAERAAAGSPKAARRGRRPRPGAGA